MSSNIVTNTPLDFTTYHNVIAGELVPSASGETYRTVNPSTLESNPEAPVSTLEDVKKAVAAAQKAAVTWADVPWPKRRELLEQFATAIEGLADDFSRLIVKENGKPLSWAAVEVQSCVKFIRGFCALSLPDRIIEDTVERKIVERFVPLGVVVGIVPWNFPLMLTIFKLPAALLTGNTFILKPSPMSPYSGLKLAELACRFFPPGVFQALSGNDDLGPWLTGQEGIDMIAFTGSIATGKSILRTAGLKRVILEMGGNDPAVVYPDVDIAQVVPQIAGIAFVNSGQLCMAIKRLYVHEAIYDEFLAALVGFVKTALKVGDGLEEGSFIGPISHQLQFDRVKGYLKEIEQKGLSVALGSTEPLDRKGYYVSPIIVDNPPDDARIVTEERFGPILPVLKWSDEADVLRRANQTEYGLGASVWTKDPSVAARIAKKFKVGTIWINTHGELEPNVGFPGYKSSGYGVELGEEGLRAYCSLQSTYTRPGKW